MRTAYLSLILAAGLAGAAYAQAPAPAAQTPAAQTPAAQTPAAQAPAAAPTTPAPTTPGPATSAPATAAPTTPTAQEPPPPTLPTTGDGAVVLSVLEHVCVPLVRGGDLDQLAKAEGMRKNRRDGTWAMGLGGARDYTITILPQGVNKDVCQAEVHYAIGQEEPIVKAINIWSFLHKPELVLQANYVNVDADGIKRERKSWEHLEANTSTAVNFTTEHKPDGSPLNRNYDTGELFYQERRF
jgi:hypothetical protein